MMHSRFAQPSALASLGVSGYLVVVFSRMLWSHVLGAEAFGDYCVAFAVLSIAASLALAGTDLAAARFIPNMRAADDHDTVRRYCGWNRRRAMRAVGWVLAFYIVFLLIAVSTHVSGYKRLEEYHLAFHALWLAPLAAVYLLLQRYLVASGHALLGGAMNGLMPAAMILPCLAVAAWVLHLRMASIPVIMGIWGVSFLVTSWLALWTLRRVEPGLHDALRFPRHGEADPRWSRTSNAMLVMRINSMVLWNMDLIIVEVVARSEVATGLYAATLVVVRIMQLIPGYVMFMIQPLVAPAYENDDELPTLQHAIDSANGLVALVSAGLFVLIIVAGRAILQTFGPEYVQATPALAVMACGALIESLARTSRVLLLNSGAAHQVTRLTMVALGVLLVAGSVATYLYSYRGMAVVMGVILAGKGLTLYTLARRRMPGLRPLSVM